MNAADGARRDPVAGDARAPRGGVFTAVAVNATALALAAAFLEQLVHEGTHAVAALLAGKRIALFHLFAVGAVWPEPGTVRPALDAAVAGVAAIVNVACGAACVLRLRRPGGRPLARLFVLYFGAYSLFAGFGYLMIDALIFSPDRPGPGDWQAVLGLLGGGWAVRAPILAIGAAGTLWGFLWLPRAGLAFLPPAGTPGRSRGALALFLVPYIAVNAVFTALAAAHPAGDGGVLIVALKFWMGFSGLAWAFPIAGLWIRSDAPPGTALELPDRPQAAALVAGGVALAAAAILASGAGT